MTIYHVLNRGVDRRKLFLNEEDYLRFVHDLFELNDADLVDNVLYRFHRKSMVVGLPYIRKKRRILVDILAFCLMPNHYHLLLTAHMSNGVPRFMHKLNGGYVKYFNEKHKRRGTLFEGGYKSIAVTTDAHFIHLPNYIHFNPLDLYMPEWRERNISSAREAMQFLEEYRWSSFPDYIGKKNFSSVTSRGFLSEFLGGPEQYRKDALKWLKDIDFSSVEEVALENLD